MSTEEQSIRDDLENIGTGKEKINKEQFKSDASEEDLAKRIAELQVSNKQKIESINVLKQEIQTLESGVELSELRSRLLSVQQQIEAEKKRVEERRAENKKALERKEQREKANKERRDVILKELAFLKAQRDKVRREAEEEERKQKKEDERKKREESKQCLRVPAIKPKKFN